MTTVSLDIVARDRASAVLSRVGSTATKVGGVLGVALGGQLLVGGLTKTISLAKNYDLTMRQVGVQTGETGKGMASLSKLALKMGADTAFSSKDAADAMLELAKGGMTSAQIKAGALNTTMTLAAAGGLNLGDAAGYVTQAMNTFGLSAAKSRNVAVALAGGANASTASVESLGMALSQVGPGAKNAGMSLQETVGVLAAFDNAGIKGSDAGTSLKTMLQRLVPATDQAQRGMDTYGLNFIKANGQMMSMTQIAGQLRTKLGPLTQSQKIQALQTVFGSDATRAATVLMNNGAKGIEKYIRATKNQGTVTKMANTAMEGASGAWNQFTGSLETAAIQLGSKMLPGFTKAANAGAQFVNKAMGWGPQISEVFGPLVSMGKSAVDALIPVGKVVGDLAGLFDKLPGPVKSVVVQGAALALLFPRLAAGATSVGGSFMVAGTRAVGFGQAMTTAGTRGEAASAAMTKLSGAAKMAAGVGGMLLLSNAASQTNSSLKTLESVGGGALMGFSVGGPIGGAIGGLGGLIYGLVSSTKKAASAFDATKGDVQSYAASVDQVSGAYRRATRAAVLNSLQKSGALTQGLNAGVGQATLIDATMGKPAAIAKVSAAIEVLKQKAKDLQAQADAAQGKANIGGKVANPAAAKAYDQLNAKAKAASKGVQGLESVIGSQSTALQKAAAQTRITAATTGKLSTVLKGFPPAAITKIKADGVDHSMTAVTDLARQYAKTPKQVRTLANLAGFDVTRAQAIEILNRMNDIPTARNIKVAANAGSAISAIAGAVGWLARFQSKTITLTTRKNNTGGGNGGKLPGPSDQTAGGRSSAAGREMDGLPSADGRRGGHSTNLEPAGANLITSMVKGIDKHKVKLKNALGKINDYVKSANDTLNDLISQRNDFAAGFQSFGSSVFADDTSTGPVSIGSVLASQASKYATAASVAADVQTAISKGLSADMLKELQAGGSGGIATLHAIAGGSTDDIAQLNNLGAATSAAYAGAGAAAGQTVYGQQIAAQAQALAVGKAVADALSKAPMKASVTLKGSTIEIAINQDRKDRGKAPLK